MGKYGFEIISQVTSGDRRERSKYGAEWALAHTHDSFAVAVESLHSLFSFDSVPEPQQTPLTVNHETLGDLTENWQSVKAYGKRGMMRKKNQNVLEMVQTSQEFIPVFAQVISEKGMRNKIA